MNQSEESEQPLKDIQREGSSALTTLDEEEDRERARQATVGVGGRSLLLLSGCWGLLLWPPLPGEARRSRGFRMTAAGGAQARPWLETAAPAPPMLASSSRCKTFRGRWTRSSAENGSSERQNEISKQHTG